MNANARESMCMAPGGCANFQVTVLSSGRCRWPWRSRDTHARWKSLLKVRPCAAIIVSCVSAQRLPVGRRSAQPAPLAAVRVGARDHGGERDHVHMRRRLRDCSRPWP
jgi:hypothetical protein